MKEKIVLILVTLILCSSCRDNKKLDAEETIAKIVDHQIVFNDKQKLIKQLENDILQIKKKEIKINEINIDSSKAFDNNSLNIIQLIGNTKDRSLQISYVLNKEYNSLYITSGNTILICEGCTIGCLPKRSTNNEGICTPCITEGIDTCFKTESLLPNQ
ncbi:hypothetical protein U8527_06680 [Kordia algicida OT-1]|uniref:Uncharacterized protein n=1 Tax=Kordia algicida OT-1 TaxID=391587 RepID=A9CU74_9FLAO|nr:hypothetical protein [Kordia algicida]EDP94133.1 hypothetical protein KAOT1_00095 [Kordia algicida OT-1]